MSLAEDLVPIQFKVSPEKRKRLKQFVLAEGTTIKILLSSAVDQILEGSVNAGN